MPESLPSRGRILVVDDEPAFRLASRAFLRQQGFECEAAGSAAEAVQFLSGAPFDLVIADIQMPGNARLEFIEQLAALPGGLRVILLTGHPSMQSAVQSVRLQVAGYLVKPCDPDELVALADQAIARRRAYQAITANRERLEGWVRDLAKLESVLREDAAGPAAGPTEAYLNLTLRNLLTALLDLKLFTEALARRDNQASSLQEAALLKALQETIAVLEKTKQSFKSRELGELRKKLEGILQPLD
jgi:CheY-like chemotaxis protein